MQTDFVLDALEQALYARRGGRPGERIFARVARSAFRLLVFMNTSDQKVLRRRVEFTQYVNIRYTERLAEAGIEPSVGSKGDSYDNALAETINGLYKAELIHRRAPWKTREAVELATLEWVSWFNHHRLLEPIGYIPPAEAEATYWRTQRGLNHEYMGPTGGPPAAPAGGLKKGESNSRSQQAMQV